jgi:hypothetical protein
MKTSLKGLYVFAISLLFGVCFSANATVIESTYNPEPDHLVTSFNSPYTYTHDLRGQLVPGVTINSVNLAVYLYDPTDLFYAFGEKITFNFDNATSSVISNVPLFGKNYTFGLATSMLNDGLLSVSLSVGCNGSVFGHCVIPQDFVFAQSVLTADVSEPVQPVPEPSSVLCFAFGLLMLGRVMRKKYSRG